jgi:hypothetical protein
MERLDSARSIAAAAAWFVLMFDLLAGTLEPCIFRACNMDAESCRAARDDPWYTTAVVTLLITGRLQK